MRPQIPSTQHALPANLPVFVGIEPEELRNLNALVTLLFLLKCRRWPLVVRSIGTADGSPRAASNNYLFQSTK